jgi:hypothetical protein
MRELLAAAPADHLSLHGWTPDGQHLLVGRGAGVADQPVKLWRVPLDGGKIVDLQFAFVPTPNPLAMSPDGRRVAYVDRRFFNELVIAPWPALPAR